MAKAEANKSLEQSERGHVSKSHSLRVLIADNDPGQTSRLRTLLTELGYTVVAEATDGREAISLARQLHPDLVLMDAKMPNVDGLEAGRQIDQEQICPIVLLTAHSDQALVRKACALSSILAYLVKPATARDLEPAIELAVHHFQRLKRLQRKTIQLDYDRDAYTVLEQAIEYLVENHHCSPQQAHAWMLREAMAEKVAVERVAWEIVAGEQDG